MITLGLFVFALSLSSSHVAAQKGQGADGNPHGWDRTRRCDHSDYSPPCGVCEGIGGIPTGDENADITIPYCKAVANASSIPPSSLVRPVWARTWHTHSYEVLIGPKKDPFCFTTIPSNSSQGKLCYRPQTGTQDYDFNQSRALREDINVYSALGNFTTVFLHQGRNLWIVNKFPWYTAGTHQCICTHAREGGDPKSQGIFPVSTNWTNNLAFVGRENITVEYDQGTHTLDHWAFGPHHVWSFPSTGRILRMWQPFNGLQILPDGTSSSPVDPSQFKDIPPSLCKKGGALFRIKCTDDGYPDDGAAHVDPTSTTDVIAATSNLTSSPLLSAVAAVTRALESNATPVSDQLRANTVVPRHAFRGQSFQDMSSVLNKWLIDNPGVATRACDEWNVTEIQELQRLLYALRDLSLDEVYSKADDNRQMMKDLDAMETEWAQLNTLAAAASDPDMAMQIRRDGHCHEAVMWYTHHLNEHVKRALAKSGLAPEIPLLSTIHHADRDDIELDDDDNLSAVMGAYEEQVTCLSCHSDSPL